MEKGTEKTDIKKMYIKYIFTEDEKNELASELSQKISEKDSLELQKKEVASKFTSEINSVNATVVRIAEEHRQGYKWCNHECYEVYDYISQEISTFRADTDEEVATRTMTVSESQSEIFNKNTSQD